VTLAGLADYVQDEVPNHVKGEFSSLLRQVPNLVGDVEGRLALAEVVDQSLIARRQKGAVQQWPIPIGNLWA